MPGTTEAEQLAALKTALRSGDLAVVRRVFDDSQKLIGPGLWFPAVSGGNLAICQMLVEFGLDVNQSGAPRRPLHFAAEFGHLAIAELLLSAGANAEVVDEDGLTPLDVACEFAPPPDDLRLIELLKSVTPAASFGTAVRTGEAETVARFLQSKPERVCNPWWLMLACRCNQPEVARMLLEAGADVNARNRRDPDSGDGGNFALWFCANRARRSRVPLAKILVEHGARVNDIGEHGETALHQAAAWNHADLAEFLIACGADTEGESQPGKTPLSVAIASRSDKVAGVLRARGAKVDVCP